MQSDSEKKDEVPVLPVEVVTDHSPRMTEAAPPAAGEPKLPHGLTRKQIALAFVIAVLSDVVSAFATVAPPIELAVDLVTAGLLFCVLRWRWLLLPGLIMEAIPGVSVFPFWVLVVGAIAVVGHARPKLN
jgi:hypothetical protein